MFYQLLIDDLWIMACPNELGPAWSMSISFGIDSVQQAAEKVSST